MNSYDFRRGFDGFRWKRAEKTIADAKERREQNFRNWEREAAYVPECDVVDDVTHIHLAHDAKVMHPPILLRSHARDNLACSRESAVVGKEKPMRERLFQSPRVLDRRVFLQALVESAAVAAAGIVAAGCSKNPIEPDPLPPPVEPPVGDGGGRGNPIQFYSGSTLVEDGRRVDVVGLLEIESNLKSARVTIFVDGNRYEVGRLTVRETGEGYLHEFIDPNGEVIAQYTLEANELAQLHTQLRALLPAAVVITAMAWGALTGMVGGFIGYTVFNFTNWTLDGAIDAAWKEALVGAALGPVFSKAETFLKPVVVRFASGLGRERNYIAALNIARRFYNEIVDAIRLIFS